MIQQLVVVFALALAAEAREFLVKGIVSRSSLHATLDLVLVLCVESAVLQLDTEIALYILYGILGVSALVCLLLLICIVWFCW